LELLKDAANDLNDYMKEIFSDYKEKGGIEIKDDFDYLKETITKTIAENFYKEDISEDKLTVETMEAIHLLGININDLKSSKESISKEETAPVAEVKEKIVNIKKEKRYTRSHALIDSLSRTGLSKQEMIEKANGLYKEKGGSGKVAVAKELLNYVLPSLLILNIVKKDTEGLYFLNE